MRREMTHPLSIGNDFGIHGNVKQDEEKKKHLPPPHISLNQALMNNSCFVNSSGNVGAHRSSGV